MRIKIHRGQNQIGGNIIEVSTDKTKILLDIGRELDDEKNKTLPDVAGLFDYKGFDAIFISHYHADHMGLAYDAYKDIPIYIGEASYKIIKASDEYKKMDTISPTGFLSHRLSIQIGDIRITPFLADHSAFDSYMILVEAEGKMLLYTGDFRSNGRKPCDWLLSQLPYNVDTLICEGTTLSRENYISETETGLEKKAVEKFQSTDGPIFVLQSSMNIDRAVTMFRAAKRCDRIFLQDLYMAEITNSINGSIPNPNSFREVKTFVTRAYSKEHFRYQLFNKYGANKISKTQIAKSKFVMCVRTSMLDYLKSLSEITPFKGGILVYSIWEGYKKQPDTIEFLKACGEWGLSIVSLHTSGHADKDAIVRLIECVKPKNIIPVHTENASWFLNNTKEINIMLDSDNLET